MAATIHVGPGFPVSNFRFGMMGKGDYFTQSRSFGALGSSHFVSVKIGKFLETRRCLNVPSVAHGMVSNVVVGDRSLHYFSVLTYSFLSL